MELGFLEYVCSVCLA